MDRSVPLPAAAAVDSLPAGPPPRCVFIAGPRGAGKTHWLQQHIQELVARQPGVRCAVVLAEDGHTRMERFARQVPGLAVRRVILPCPCCPALAQLPDTMRELVRDQPIDWIFVETPALAVAGLLEGFDRELGWPREVVACLDAAWEVARHRQEVPPFLIALLELADTVVAAPAPAEPGVSPGSPLAERVDIILT